MLWWDDFAVFRDSEGGPVFYGPAGYDGAVLIMECKLCCGYGRHKFGVCVRCAGHGRIARPDMDDYDKCEKCRGLRGGVPGNENIIEGITLCDYCSADKH